MGPIATRYEAKWPDLFDPAVVGPAVDFLAVRAGDGPVLELGIGTGRLALPLSRRGLHVHGIELSSDMVDQLGTHDGADAITVTLGDFATNVAEGCWGSATLAYLVRNTIMNLTTQDAAGGLLRQRRRASGAWRLLRDGSHGARPPATPTGRDRAGVHGDADPSGIRGVRRRGARVDFPPLLDKRWQGRDLLGAVPLRVARRAGPDGAPGGDDPARALERLGPIALHERKPQPHLCLAKGDRAARRAARSAPR